MHKALLLALIASFAIFPLMAADFPMQRFLPPAPPAEQLPPLIIPQLPPQLVPAGVSSTAHNKGVTLNNQGIDALDKGRAVEALTLFSAASEQDPGEPEFIRNYLIALKKAPNRPPAEILKASRRLMSAKPDDFFGAYSAGFALMSQMQKPLEALPYLEKARQLKPSDHQISVTTAQAYEKAGFPLHALELLKTIAHLIPDDPFPLYFLGRLLQANGEDAPAIRALKSALGRDAEGYVHDQYIRTCYNAGKLENLVEVCREALKRFPKIANRSILERIYLSLIPRHIILVETIEVSIANPEFLTELKFLVDLIPSIPSQQDVTLKKAEILKGGEVFPVEPSHDQTSNQSCFSCPAKAWSEKTVLRLHYQISTYPVLHNPGGFARKPSPNLGNLKSDPRLNLDDPRLQTMADTISRLGGDFLTEAYRAVARGLNYVENFEFYPVDWCLSNPDKCDCTEYSMLFAALCLKKNIPARVVVGFLLKPGAEGEIIKVGHAWTEIFQERLGWVPFDATRGASCALACFRNRLSDQIFFSALETGNTGRININMLSEKPQNETHINSYYQFYSDKNTDPQEVVYGENSSP